MTPAEYTVESVRVLRECEAKGRSLQNAAALLNWTPAFTKRICDKHAIRLQDIGDMVPVVPRTAPEQRPMPVSRPEPEKAPPKKMGRPRRAPEETQSVTLGLAMTERLARKLVEHAKAAGVTKSTYARMLIERAIEQESSPVASA